MTPHPSLPRVAATPLLVPALAALAAALAPAQSVNYTWRNGANMGACGALVGGPFAIHSFLTPVSNSDSISLNDPGTATAPPSTATAQFDAVATQNVFSIAVAGTSSRGGPPAIIAAVTDGRDNWQFTITAAMRFTLNASLSAASTEATVPTQHFTFGGSGIVPDLGAPAPPYQRSLNAPGSVSLAATGTLMPGTYGVTVFGRAEGTTFPYSGSYANSLTLTLQPAATVTTRTAVGNPNAYSGDAPLLGQTWHANVDLAPTGHAFSIVYASLSPAQLALGPGLTLLIAPPVVEFLPIAAGPQAIYTFFMPANPALAGFQLSTQALLFGGAPSFALSNALDLTLGS